MPLASSSSVYNSWPTFFDPHVMTAPGAREVNKGKARFLEVRRTPSASVEEAANVWRVPQHDREDDGLQVQQHPRARGGLQGHASGTLLSPKDCAARWQHEKIIKGQLFVRHLALDVLVHNCTPSSTWPVTCRVRCSTEL